MCVDVYVRHKYAHTCTYIVYICIYIFFSPMLISRLDKTSNANSKHELPQNGMSS